MARQIHRSYAFVRKSLKGKVKEEEAEEGGREEGSEDEDAREEREVVESKLLLCFLLREDGARGRK